MNQLSVERMHEAISEIYSEFLIDIANHLGKDKTELEKGIDYHERDLYEEAKEFYSSNPCFWKHG